VNLSDDNSMAFRAAPAANEARRGRRVRHGRDGQVLAMVILCIPVLVGMIFYVYNTGDQINRRLVLQNAADSAGISGGTWMARSMNVVAMNNVAQVRLIALLLTMDSLPLAAEMTVAEETPPKVRLTDALEKWKNVGPPFTPYERENFFRQGLAELYRQMSEGEAGQDGANHYDKRQLELVKKIDAAFDAPEERKGEGGYDVKDSTQWDRGAIWQAVLALDEFSQVTAETAGFFAQQNAVAHGKQNDTEAAFLVPLLPKFPGYRGTWNDFEPVFLDRIQIVNDARTGREIHRIAPSNLVSRLKVSTDVARDVRLIDVHGGAIPDFAFPQRIGPFARVYLWRDYGYNDNKKPWWDPTRQVWAMGYWTYGPMENALRIVLDQFGGAGHFGSADTSRFEFHLRTVAKLKLAYLFGLPAPKTVQYADQWITDYNEAKAYAEAHAKDSPSPIMTTRYYQVGVVSTVKWDDEAHWMKTYELQQPTDTKVGEPVFTPRRWHSHQLRCPPPEAVWHDLGNPRVQPLYEWRGDQPLTPRGSGWAPTIESARPGGWQRLTDYVWIQKAEHQVKEHQDLNLPPRYLLKRDGSHDLKVPDGPDAETNWTPILYPIYTVAWRVFGGIELREEVEVTNPAEGSTIATLPAPILLDTQGESFLRISLPPEDPKVFPVRITTEQGSAVRDVHGVQVKPFMYLGAARRPIEAEVWPRGFYPGNPSNAMVAVAQVKVFNNRSWDLWTQDWHAQLMPVEGWSDWVNRIKPADANAAAGIAPEAVEETQRYMSAFTDRLMQRYMRH
jgi:hypothetical protein